MLTLERPAFNGAMLSTGYIGTGFDLNSIAAVGGGRHHRHSGQPPGVDLLRTGGHCHCIAIKAAPLPHRRPRAWSPLPIHVP